MARPVYSETMAQEVIERMSRGEMVAAVCRDLGIGINCVYRWIADNSHGFRDKWEEARRDQIESILAEIKEIADSCPANSAPVVNRAQLQIKTRQWIVERLNQMSGSKASAAREAREEVAAASEPSQFLSQWLKTHGAPASKDVN